jgi:hypothetical protein
MGKNFGPKMRRAGWPNLDHRAFACKKLADSGIMPPMKYWEIIADKLHASSWSLGYCSAITPYGWRWIVDVHREGRRYMGGLTNS